MYVRTYKYRQGHLVVWFEDNGKLLDIMLLKPFRKGLFTVYGLDYPNYSLAYYKALRSEWEEIPYEPCLVALEDEHNRILNLNWGIYQDKELSSRARKMVVPLDCLTDFILEYLDSHEDYTVNIDYLCEIYNEAIPQMAYPRSIGIPYENLSKTLRRYLSEVL